MNTGDLVLTPRGLLFQGRRFPCSVGRGRITTDKREGDGATPAGVHRVEAMYYRPDRIRKPASWAQPIGPGDLWSDDPRDPQYNSKVRRPHGYSHELLRRGDPLYDLVMVMDWNRPNSVPGRGSAIFIHQWRRPGFPTEGCIALNRVNLLWIAQRLLPGTHVIVRPWN